MSKIIALAELLLAEILLMEKTNCDLQQQNKELLEALKKYRQCVKENNCEGKIKFIGNSNEEL